MPVECLRFKARKSNTLCGFADVVLTNVQLEIREITLHQKGDRRWVGLPGKPQIDKNGQAIWDGNKIKYVNILSWTSREASDQFSRAVIAAVLEKYPQAFGEEGEGGDDW
jgi:hypothetical protein